MAAAALSGGVASAARGDDLADVRATTEPTVPEKIYRTGQWKPTSVADVSVAPGR